MELQTVIPGPAPLADKVRIIMTFQAAGNIELSPELKAAADAMVQKVRANPIGIPKEVLLAETQRGEALAETAIHEARGQANAWARIYHDMLKLTAEGRTGFRKITAKHAKEMREHVKAGGDTDALKRTRNSALVRLSELNTISKAIDNGAVFDKEWPFHYAVGHARASLESDGKADKRGRPAKPWLDKLKEFVAKNVPVTELHTAAELLETMAAVAPKADAPV